MIERRHHSYHRFSGLTLSVILLCDTTLFLSSMPALSEGSNATLIITASTAPRMQKYRCLDREDWAGESNIAPDRPSQLHGRDHSASMMGVAHHQQLIYHTQKDGSKLRLDHFDGHGRLSKLYHLATTVFSHLGRRIYLASFAAISFKEHTVDKASDQVRRISLLIRASPRLAPMRCRTQFHANTLNCSLQFHCFQLIQLQVVIICPARAL
jgi:hypothetical protein